MKYFETILVPVDFSINTNVAIKKALEFATADVTAIHLLHVYDPKRFMSISDIRNPPSSLPASSTKMSLNMLASEIQRESKNVNVIVKNALNKSIQNAIIAESKSINADLIIIGKKTHHSVFSFLNTVISANIAEVTDCPVLTVKPGSLNKKIETVVMPISNSFPNKKIDLLFTLNTSSILNIHLITILGNDQLPDNHSASALLQSLKSIKNKIKCNVQHSIIHSNNKAVATLRYAEKVNADVLLLSTQSETNIPSWISKREITDIVNPASQLQVISVQPN